MRFFANCAVILPLLDGSAEEAAQELAALINDCAKYFSTLFIRELIAHPFHFEKVEKDASIYLPEIHFMVRNLAILNMAKEFKPLTLWRGKGWLNNLRLSRAPKYKFLYFSKQKHGHK